MRNNWVVSQVFKSDIFPICSIYYRNIYLINAKWKWKPFRLKDLLFRKEIWKPGIRKELIIFDDKWKGDGIKWKWKLVGANYESSLIKKCKP
jgi:hypothetical protein